MIQCLLQTSLNYRPGTQPFALKEKLSAGQAGLCPLLTAAELRHAPVPRVKECFPLLCHPLAHKTAFKHIHQSFEIYPACQSQNTVQGKAWQPEPAASQGRVTPREEP